VRKLKSQVCCDEDRFTLTCLEFGMKAMYITYFSSKFERIHGDDLAPLSC
jgi:hypothetical protein